MTRHRQIAILGGGIIGLCCAYALTRRGLQVTVFDAHKMGRGASWGNCGLLEPSHADPMTQPAMLLTGIQGCVRRDQPLAIRWRRLMSRPGWFLSFARHANNHHRAYARQVRHDLLTQSLRLYRQWFDDGIDMDRQDTGLLTLYRSPSTLDAHQRVHESLAREPGGLEFDVLSRDQLTDRLNSRPHDRVVGAIHSTTDAHVDPRTIATVLPTRLQEMGCLLQEDMAVRLGRSPDASDRCSVITESGTQDFDQVVVAAGWQSRSMLGAVGINVPIEPGKGLSVTWSGTTAPVPCPIYFYDQKVVLTPFRDGFRLGSMMDFNGGNITVDPARLELLRSAPGHYLNWNAPQIDSGLAWAGLRPMCVDELPIVGRASKFSNLLLACGHGQLGVSLGAITGELIGRLCVGDDSVNASAKAISPARFGC